MSAEDSPPSQNIDNKLQTHFALMELRSSSNSGFRKLMWPSDGCLMEALPLEVKQLIISYFAYDYPHVDGKIHNHPLNIFASISRAWNVAVEDYCKHLLSIYRTLPGMREDPAAGLEAPQPWTFYSTVEMLSILRQPNDTMSAAFVRDHAHFPPSQVWESLKVAEKNKVTTHFQADLRTARELKASLEHSVPYPTDFTADMSALQVSYRTAWLHLVKWRCCFCFDQLPHQPLSEVQRHAVHAGALLRLPERLALNNAVNELQQAPESTFRNTVHDPELPSRVARFDVRKIVCEQCDDAQWPGTITWAQAKKEYRVSDEDLLWPPERLSLRKGVALMKIPETTDDIYLPARNSFVTDTLLVEEEVEQVARAKDGGIARSYWG